MKHDHDVLIIGGGPAGASAAVYVARGGFSACIVDGGASALKKAERIENYYGTGAVSGAALFSAGLDGARAAGADVLSGQVTFASSDGRGFTANATAGELRAKKLVIATGATRKTASIDDGGAGISYCAVCDAFFYRKKRVGVIGAGEFARHEYAALENVVADIALFTDGAEPCFEAKRVYKQKLVGTVRDADGKLIGVKLDDGTGAELDGLFVAIGVAGATSLAKSMGIFVNGDGAIVTDAHGETNIHGLFAAGDCTAGVRQVAKAACDGMTAAFEIIKQLKSE